MATAMGGRTEALTDLVVRMVGDATSYLRMLKTVEAQTVKTAAVVSTVATRMQGFGSSLATFMASLHLGMGLFRITKSFAEFDKAITESAAIIKDITENDIVGMRKAAMDLSMTGTVVAKDLGQSFYFMASAGYAAGQAIEALPALSKFAVAGAFDIERATSLLIDSQSALGLKVANTTDNYLNLVRVSDVLIRANELANASARQFSESLTSNAAGALRLVNKEIEEGAAVLAVYADAGNKGRKAGSDLARLLTILAATARLNKKKHQKLGFQVFETEGPKKGQMRNVADIMANLEQIMGKMTPRARDATLAMLGFKTLVQRVIKPLIGTSDQIRRFERELKDAAGTTDRVANRQLKAFANQMQIVRNHVTALMIDIGETLAPAFMKVGEAVKFVVVWFRSLDKNLKIIIIAGMALVAAFALLGPILYLFGPLFASMLGPIAMVMGGLVHMLHLSTLVHLAWIPIVASLRLFLGILLLIINPLRLIRFLILSVVIAFKFFFGPEVTLIFTLLKIAAIIAILIINAGGFGAAWDQLEKAAKAFWEWALPIRQALVSLSHVVWDLLVEAFLAMGHEMMELIRLTVEWLGIDWKGLAETIRSALVDTILLAEFVITHFGQTAQYVWVAFQYFAVRTLNAISDFFTGNVTDWSLSIADFIMWFDTAWTTAWKGAAAIIAGIALAIISVLQTAIENIFVFREKTAAIAAGQAVDWMTGWKSAIDPAFLDDLLKPENIDPFIAPFVSNTSWKKMEKDLKKEYEKLGAGVAVSFAEFRAKKLEEFAKINEGPIADKARQEAKKQGAQTGEDYVDGFSKEMRNLDNVLFNSAEAVSRILEYRDRLFGDNPDKMEWKGDVKHEFDEMPKFDPDMKITRDSGDKSEDYLKDIRAAVVAQAKKPPLSLQVATL